MNFPEYATWKPQQTDTTTRLRQSLTEFLADDPTAASWLSSVEFRGEGSTLQIIANPRTVSWLSDRYSLALREWLPSVGFKSVAISTPNRR